MTLKIDPFQRDAEKKTSIKQKTGITNRTTTSRVLAIITVVLPLCVSAGGDINGGECVCVGGC